MEYISDAVHLTIKGMPDALRRYVYEISEIMDGGTSYSQIEDTLDTIETLREPFQYTFGLWHRIYIEKDRIQYVPNVSGLEAKIFHTAIFKKLSDMAIQKMKGYEIKRLGEEI